MLSTLPLEFLLQEVAPHEKPYSGMFCVRDKPQNATAGGACHFVMGGSTAGKSVTERNTMQMTAGKKRPFKSLDPYELCRLGIPGGIITFSFLFSLFSVTRRTYYLRLTCNGQSFGDCRISTTSAGAADTDSCLYA